MDKYFFDCRTNDALVADDEGRDFQDVDAVHREAFLSLADWIRDVVTEQAGCEQRIAVEVRDKTGPILTVRVLFASEILRTH